MGPASFLLSCPPSATLAAARSLLAPAAAAADAASAETNPQRVCPEKPGLLEQGLGWLTLPDGRERSEPAGRGREQGLSQPLTFPALPTEGGRRLGLEACSLSGCV